MPRLTAPPRALRLVLIAGVLPALAFGLAACDNGGGMDDDPPPSTTDSVTVSAEAVTDDGSRIDSAAIAFDGTEAGTGYAEKTYEKDADRSVSVSASEDDYVNTETSIDLGADQNISLEMLEELPETVTVPFENVAADGDTLITGTVMWDDSVVAEDVRSAEVAIPASRDTGELCVQESDLFHAGCTSVTPTSDFSEVQAITAERKTVTYTINPDVPYGEQSAVDVSVSGSKVFEGSGSVDVPKLSASKNRLVSGNLETADQDNSSKVDRLYADTTVSSFENIELTLTLSRLDACSDHIDNDGDGFADKAETRACTDLDENYDPHDDNEVLKGTTLIIGRYFGSQKYVSSAEGERETKINKANNPLPWSITVAKGEVGFAIEADMHGNAFAMHFDTGGSNDNLTVEDTSDIAVGQDTSDGFVLKPVTGIDRSTFADGPYWALSAWDDSKANGDPPGGGVDRVDFYKGQQNSRLHRISWAYEEEDVPEDKIKSTASVLSAQSATLTKPGECEKVSPTDEVCRVPAGSFEF